MQFLTVLLPLAALAAANPLENRAYCKTTTVTTTSKVTVTTTSKTTVTTTSKATVTTTLPASTVTTTLPASTVTTTLPASTVTVTTTPTPTKTCLTKAEATGIVNNFIDLLEYTSYQPANGSQIPPGRGYHYNTSAVTLAPDFVDISDSINFLAGFPLGSVTFPNKTAFDYGQGVLQPEVDVTTLNIFTHCRAITWRWLIKPNPYALPVNGINYMIINDDGLIQKNYAEFDSGAWLQSFGQQCAVNPIPPPVSPALKRSTIPRPAVRRSVLPRA